MPDIGIKGMREITVTDEMSAESMGSGELRVCATPAIIALIEETAWRSIADSLDEGQSTVGTRIDVAHIAATPIGMRVRCETELIETDRRKLVFSVNVYDEKGKIAEGTHERFIVDAKSFVSKAYGEFTPSL